MTTNHFNAKSHAKTARTVKIDIMRFVAAVSVMLYHYVAWYTVNLPQESIALHRAATITQFGWLGVPLFFMISGYVILNSALNRDVRQFAIARFVRLYPMYWICLAATVAVLLVTGNLHGEPVRHSVLDLRTLLANLAMMQEVRGCEPIDGVYWTLWKELQFYVLMCVLIATGVVKRVRVWLTTWLALTCTFLLFNQPFFMGWFISPEYSACFIGGIAFSLIRTRGLNRFNGLVAILAAGLACWEITRTAGTFMDVSTVSQIVVCQIIVLLFFGLFGLVVMRKIDIKPSQRIATLGMITYPLYLLHNNIGKSTMNQLLPVVPVELLAVGMSITSIAIAWCVYSFVDKPTSHWLKSKLANNRPSESGGNCVTPPAFVVQRENRGKSARPDRRSDNHYQVR